MNLNPVNRFSGPNRETDVNPEIRKGSTGVPTVGEHYKLEANEPKIHPHSTKAGHEGINYFKPKGEDRPLLRKEVQGGDLSSMGKIRRYKEDNCCGQQSGQQQAKTSDKSVQREPVLLALKNQDEEGPRQGQGQQLDQSSNALLGRTIQVHNIAGCWKRLQKGGIHEEAAKQGLKSKDGRQTNAPPGNKFRQDWATPPARQASFREKVSRCCEAFCQACIRCINFRSPFS